MVEKQHKTAYYWLIKVAKVGKKYQITPDQVETIKEIWDELHQSGYWFSFNESSIIKFKQ